MASGRSSLPARSALGTLSALCWALLLGACTTSSAPKAAVEVQRTPAVAATSAAVSATLIPHPLDGWEDCLFCHGEGRPQAVPADHAGRADDTCLACHDWQPPAARSSGASTAELGEAIWSAREGLTCRNCHGARGEGGFGPSLANTSLDFGTFLQRTRSPVSSRMPPIARSPDDPAIERSSTWVSDQDLRLIYDWLSGTTP